MPCLFQLLGDVPLAIQLNTFTWSTMKLEQNWNICGHKPGHVATYVMFTQDMKNKQPILFIISIPSLCNKTAFQSCIFNNGRQYFQCHSYVKKLIDYSFYVKIRPQLVIRQNSMSQPFKLMLLP